MKLSVQLAHARIGLISLAGMNLSEDGVKLKKMNTIKGRLTADDGIHFF